MIRMNYGTAEQQKKIEKRFIDLLDNRANRNSEWHKLRTTLCNKSPDFKNILPENIEEIMTLPFQGLVDIYIKYVDLKLPKSDQLHNDLKSLFSYENSKGKNYKAMRPAIIEFFKDRNNGFEIHTCHYCDMTYINYFNYGRNKRTQFDLDHVLDKGSCPIVALSLYNLVPSCPTCNGPHIKGKRKMAVEKEQRIKLSPTSTQYDFENKVKIWLRPRNAKLANINLMEHSDDYSIEFDTRLDKDYDNEIDFFHLRERYEYHKCEALRLKDLQNKYTASKIKELAHIICNTGNDKSSTTFAANNMVDQIRNDIFELNYMKRHHRAFSKLHYDILEYEPDNKDLSP